ncbi:carboxyl transferase domain-containing protein, partial [Streptomyces sp. NPDC127084]|uniref:carboxyl transferase domain-containing protein n=1 Tax=Streptomyces sp. NPDC127084 TaxID=3347133 RepID=UPI003650C9C1
MTDGLTARTAIALVAEGFEELEGFEQQVASDEVPRTGSPAGTGTSHPDDGPIGWDGYGASRARAAARSGERESVVWGVARIGECQAVVVSFEFRFMGGSLGQRTGDRLESAYAHARAERLPLVSLIATGGSRMQEGMIALTQLQRVARAAALTRAAGLPQIAVLRDPTTGGGWATLGAGADVILALPGAQIGFAGSRVRPQDADPSAYTATGQLAAGQIDAIVRQEELRETLASWLVLLTGGARQDQAPDQVTVEAPTPPFALGGQEPAPTGWGAVRLARSARRPRAQAYLDAYFGPRLDIQGDRCGGTDPGMLCGFGLREGRTVAYAAQAGTATRPAGYRTAARLVRLADRLGIPVLTLVDTPGAANDAEAEREGAGAGGGPRGAAGGGGRGAGGGTHARAP